MSRSVPLKVGFRSSWKRVTHSVFVHVFGVLVGIGFWSARGWHDLWVVPAGWAFVVLGVTAAAVQDWMIHEGSNRVRCQCCDGSGWIARGGG